MHLTLLLDMAREGFGDRTVVGSRTGGLSVADLDRITATHAERLQSSGATALVYLGVNGSTFPAALLSAARAGIPLVPLNYRLGDDQLLQLIANHPGALVLADPAQRARLVALDVPSIEFTSWWEHGSPEAKPPETQLTPSVAGATESPDAAVVIYTSGSTSTPKGVVLRHANLVSYVLSNVEFGAASADDAAMISVPPYHIAAVANVITNLYAGRRTVVLEQFEPRQWIETVIRESVTNALVVPTMLARIVDAGQDAPAVPTLRTLSYGGAPMPASVITRALAMFPGVDFVNAYGLTETSSTIAVLGPDDHRDAISSDDPDVRARLGSAGRVVPAVELEIRDDDGRALPAGETGRIWVRGPQVSGEYQGVGSVLDEHGYFDTRDRGRVDAAGFLFIAGRADDTIIRGGENIAPAEIEEVLLAHPDVVDAVVVGVPDEEWGQRIEAAVVLRAGSAADPAALRNYVRVRLRGSKTPDRVAVWQDLPRTDTGKLIRREAVARLADDPAPAGAPRGRHDRGTVQLEGSSRATPGNVAY